MKTIEAMFSILGAFAVGASLIMQFFIIGLSVYRGNFSGELLLHGIGVLTGGMAMFFGLFNRIRTFIFFMTGSLIILIFEYAFYDISFIDSPLIFVFFVIWLFPIILFNVKKNRWR